MRLNVLSRSKTTSSVKAKDGRQASKLPDPQGSRRRISVSERTTLLGLIVLLNVIGMVIVLSASSVESILKYGTPWSVFIHQVTWVVLGAVAFFAASRVDYRKWQRLTTPILIATIALLVFVLVPHIGLHADGSSRWIGAGPIKIQPSELAKLALVLFCADLFSRREEWIDSWKKCLRPFVILFGLLALLILKQPDMGTTMILVVIAIGTLYAAGLPGKKLAVSGVIIVAGAILIGLAEPYRRARLTSFLHPFAQRSNAGYQVVQSLSALGSGHVLGVGLGASRAKWGFLPNAYTDFIFTVIGEELGLIGALVIVGLFGLLAVLGIRAARRAPDRFGALVITGVICWVVGQAVINMGTVVGLMPVTGVPLPFISYGGSSLVIMMVAMGIVLNIDSSSESRSRSSARTGSFTKRSGSPFGSVSNPRDGGKRHERPPHVGRYSRRASMFSRHTDGRRL
jgi:cell division protein FtsW